MTNTTLKIPTDELDALHELARQAGVSTQDAFRHGARLYLNALLAPKTRRGRPPKGPEK